MEVQEIKQAIQDRRLFKHKEKGHTYRILKLIKSKHPDTGEWYDAVVYKQLESSEEFVRSVKSFINNFK